MSESSKQTDALTNDVNEQVLSCPICAELYSATANQVPKILPCHHSLCEHCLKRLAEKSANVSIRCPTCRNVSNVPVPGGVSSLPNNYVILELLEIVTKHKEDSDKIDSLRAFSSRKRRALTCCYCDSPTTVSECKGCDDCDGIWCGECQDIHRRGKMYKSHELLSYEEYIAKADGKQRSTLPAIGSSRTATRCKKHYSKDIDMYCLECEEMVCVMCFASDHPGHRMTTIQEAAKAKAEKIGEICAVVDERESVIGSAALLATTHKILYEKHVAGLEARIQTSAQSLCNVIIRKKHEALREVRTRTTENIDRLAAEQVRLENTKGRVRKSIVAAETAILCGCAFEICRSGPEVMESLHALSVEIEQQQHLKEEQLGQAPRFSILADGLEEIESTAARLFRIVDEESLSLCLPDVSSASAVEAALNGLLQGLQSTSPMTLHLGLVCTIMHIFDGIYTLAWSDPAHLNELGAAKVSTLLVGLLSNEGVRMDPVLVEKGLQAASALCQFRGRDSISGRNLVNIDALVQAGICAEVVMALRKHGGSCVGVCEAGLLAVRHLAVTHANTAILLESGVCEEIVAVLRVHGPTSAAVFVATMWAIKNLTWDDVVATTRLADADICEELVAMFRVHGRTGTALCEVTLQAIRNLACDDATATRLIDVGVCEEVVAALRVHGLTSAAVCEAAMRAIRRLASDNAATATRLRIVGVCEALVAVLRVHGPACAAVCEEAMRVIRNLAYDDGTAARLTDVGACEELVAVLRAHRATSVVVCEVAMVAMRSLLTCDDRATASRLSDAGACEEVVAVLRVHGPTSAAVCEDAMGAITHLACHDTAIVILLSDAGACEEMIALLRLHGPTSSELCKQGMSAIYNLAFHYEEATDRLRDAGACEAVVKMLEAHADDEDTVQYGVDIIDLLADRDPLSMARLVAAGARELMEALRVSEQHSAIRYNISSALAILDAGLV